MDGQLKLVRSHANGQSYCCQELGPREKPCLASKRDMVVVRQQWTFPETKAETAVHRECCVHDFFWKHVFYSPLLKVVVGWPGTIIDRASVCFRHFTFKNVQLPWREGCVTAQVSRLGVLFVTR